MLLKNYDEALQEFIWHATQLGQQGVPAGTPNAPVDKDTANRDMEQGLAGLKTLGELILTNGKRGRICRVISSGVHFFNLRAQGNSANSSMTLLYSFELLAAMLLPRLLAA